MPNLSTFVGSFKTELARPNRFNVLINPPGVLLGSGNYSRQLSFRCETAELPGKTFMTHDQKIYGPVEKYPYQHAYNDLNLTFIVSGDMIEKMFFDS